MEEHVGILMLTILKVMSKGQKKNVEMNTNSGPFPFCVSTMPAGLPSHMGDSLVTLNDKKCTNLMVFWCDF